MIHNTHRSEGYYWVKTTQSNPWQVAHFYKGNWWVVGTGNAWDLYLFQIDENMIKRVNI